MKCEKCQKELPTLGGKWTSRFTVYCHYLRCEVNLCTECYEHYEKALKVFEHEFLTGSPRKCMTMPLNFNEEALKELCDQIVEQIRTGELQLVEGPKGEWIPISEGVPIKNNKVLATFVNGVVGTAYYSDDSYVGDLVAWMPLPEPYKKGGESDADS